MATVEHRHYEVVSPPMTEYFGGQAPPETGICWAMVEAPTAKRAIALAVKSPEFRPWVDEARGDHVPPFKGLKAQRAVCDHGVCWGCGTECEECLRIYDEEMAS